MRLRIVSLALLVGTVCGGQTGSTGITSSGRVQVGEAPKPLKCGKYAHVEYQEHTCLSDGCWNQPVPPYCAPDLHVVTEKEWISMQERLKKLETAVVSSKTITKKFEPDGGTYSGLVVISSPYIKPPKSKQ
jgi:hypothetical protein